MSTLVRARIVRAERVLDWASLDTPRSPARVIRRELVQAREEAARILQAAEAQAQERLASFESSKAQAFAEAKERGHQEGLSEAAAQVAAQIAQEQRQLVSNETRIVALARLLAERLLGHLLEVDPTTVRDMALTLLREVRGARRVTIAVNPEDVAMLTRALTPAVDVLEVSVEGRAELARGDFQLSTDVGSLEGSLGSRLDLLAKRLGESLGS